MGGSGGGGYGGSGDSAALADRARQELARQELIAEVNDYLGELRKGFNDRDAQLINDRLTDVLDCLGEEVADVDRLLFGGSVAKHTYVDGLSDVDALIVMRNVEADNPSALVDGVADAIRNGGPSDVADVSAGNLAVTITYTDGSQVQLLPAQEHDGRLRIASEDGSAWREIRPRKFAEKLTEVNQANGGGVVPVTKLAKALVQQLPEQHRLSGYHVEAIAVDAFKNYNGPKNRQAMLRHLLDHASSAVLRPTGDITGQSVHIDSYLGSANSDARKDVASDIKRIVRRMDSAMSVSDYESLFGD